MSFQILVGDVVERLREIPDNSVDSVVTDPPYGIHFMGKDWDKFGSPVGVDHLLTSKRSGSMHAGHNDLRASAMLQFQIWTLAWAVEALRVLKPGGHLLCFASTRTYHRMASGVEDGGFEIRDQIGWLFGQGFPKSHNLSGEWTGWGTALKPSWEPICLARKPFSGTVADNVALHGTGALHINACRVEGEPVPINKLEKWSGFGQEKRPDYVATVNDKGRWPANVVHDGSEEVLSAFPDAPGQQGDLVGHKNSTKSPNGIFGKFAPRPDHFARKDDTFSAARVLKETRSGEPSAEKRYIEEGSTNFAALPGDRRFDTGSPSRFFYCAKTTKKDRGNGNDHPTVKPTELMRWLCRLITPPGGTVLDCFLGSGSTGKAALLEGFHFIGIEREESYCIIARKRLEDVLAESPLFNAETSA